MYISKEDLEILKKIELYLWNKNELELYLKLWKINESLRNKREETNKKNWKRIKEKRKNNKNYARSEKEKKKR